MVVSELLKMMQKEAIARGYLSALSILSTLKVKELGHTLKSTAFRPATLQKAEVAANSYTVPL